MTGPSALATHRPTATVVPGPRLADVGVLDRPGHDSLAGPTGQTGQYSFDELGDPLRDITFVVVDLETTGGSSTDDAITEFGAVKVRGGEVLGEFATLVDPGRSIPPQITVLTGISDATVFDAPRIGAVLPAFLEFIRGTVLVAHNAGFDVGFLKAACRQLDLPWPGNQVVDTVKVARAVLTKDEAPSVRLSALAMLFRARTTPDHRALHDARATVDVLHGLFERVGGLGVQSLAELQHLSRNVPVGHRRKRHLAEHLPAAPGVYLFKGRRGEVLYVGTSRNLRQRVRSYFGGRRDARAYPPDGRPGRTGGLRGVLACTGGPGSRAAHDRRSPTGLQPPVPAARQGALGDADRRALSAAVHRLDGARRRRPAWARSRTRRTPRWRWRRSRRWCGIRRCSQRLSRKPCGTPCALAEIGKCGAPCAGRESQEQLRRTRRADQRAGRPASPTRSWPV